MKRMLIPTIFRGSFFVYLLKFLSAFVLLYGATLLIIGLASPENHYSPFVARYLDFVTVLRRVLLSLSTIALQVAGYTVVRTDELTLAIAGGRGVRIVYSCVGYGVLSFWAAFVFANRGKILAKLAWLAIGFTLLTIINVLRICLLAVAVHQGSDRILGLDHHLFFNILAYILIFLLIGRYDRQQKRLVIQTMEP